MRTLLCALAGLALLRAAGASAGMGSQCVDQAGLRLLASSDPPTQPPKVLGLKAQATISSPRAAEPFSPPRGDAAQSTACDRHMAVQRRLDVMEEMVEKTVEHLATEMKGLLGLLEGLAWNLPPGPSSPAPDLLGEDGF
ncbi:placenta-specific protein 9 isoform X1 [Saimiri boliviensis]|uniref:placenta-specific protein 9 isoform X1 n=1 Tax=Saimiri boliviensis TaxID=27679 RepID=UPI003D785BD8